jgi:hypothetical protein
MLKNHLTISPPLVGGDKGEGDHPHPPFYIIRGAQGGMYESFRLGEKDKAKDLRKVSSMG